MRLKPGDRLPPVLPVVLYNGDKAWNAPTGTMELVALPPNSPLWHWQPQIRYHLVDEKALPGSELERRDSLVALLFRLEAAPGPADLVDLVDEIIGWFRQHPDYETLKQLFTEIVGYALAEQAGFANEQTALPANDLLEIRDMVPERFKRWADEVRARRWLNSATKHCELAPVLAESLSSCLAAGSVRTVARLSPNGYRSAKAEELDEWMDRVMDAATVSDVFDDKPAQLNPTGLHQPTPPQPPMDRRRRSGSGRTAHGCGLGPWLPRRRCRRSCWRPGRRALQL